LWHGIVGSDPSSEVVLDEFIEYNPPPTIVKIDVEGEEGNVLAGMVNLLQKHQPLLYIEVHPQFLSDMQEDVRKRLESTGYELHFTDHREESDWKEIEERPHMDKEFLLRAR